MTARVALTRPKILRECGAGGRTRTGTSLSALRIFVPLRLSPPPVRAFVVWTIPSPWPQGRRRRPSSLYTFPGRSSQGLARDRHSTGFPEFERFYVRGFPQRTRGRSPSPLRLPISPRPRSPSGLPQPGKVRPQRYRVRAERAWAFRLRSSRGPSGPPHRVPSIVQPLGVRIAEWRHGSRDPL